MIFTKKSNSQDLNTLLRNLCENFLEECDQSELKNKISLNDLKRISYEILLNKSGEYTQSNKDIQDVQREFDLCLFEYKLAASGDPFKQKQIKELEKLIEYISNEPFFQTDLGQNILKFLLYLRAPASVETEKKFISKPLPLPSSFSLISQKDSTYSLTNISEANGPFTIKFKALKNDNFNLNNPYLPRFQSKSVQTIRIPHFNPSTISLCNAIKSSSSTWSIKSFGSSNLSNFSNYKFFEKNSDDEEIDNKSETVSKKSKTSKKTSFESKPITDDDNFKSNWNWENLGSNKVKVTPPFATECNSIYVLKSIASSQNFVAKIVLNGCFIADLKALAVGIQSDSFFYDGSSMTFHIVPDITIEEILPQTMENFVQEFLECGTCFKRIQIMIDYHVNYYGSDNQSSGFIFKTLCSSVSEYLVQFRQFVFSCQENTILGLYSKMKGMMQQLCSLAIIFAVHPNDCKSTPPPMGSQFLGYLYKEINHAIQKDLILLLVYIFKRCSNVYFKYLQKWIYHGILDDPCNELFINFVDHYRPQTKYFYDKAYFVRKDFVPGFFQGFEDKILQCGKYTQILKAYKPNHPLFNIEYPQITICLTFDEILQLQIKCQNYYDNVQKLCGKPVTVKDVFHKKMKQKKDFYELVQQKIKENLQKWLNDKEELYLQQTEIKRKFNKELQEQLEEIKKRKYKERQDNLEFELKLLKEMQEKEDKQIELENIILQQRVAHYKELHDLMDKKMKKNFEVLPSPITTTTTTISNENITIPSITLHESPESPDTDFESCIGDDEENHSVYEETLNTPDFIHKLHETDEELLKQNELTVTAGTTMKKSASDILNCNEISEFIRNRNRVLGSNLDFNEDAITNTQDQALKVDIDNETLTDAQKNKIKILSHEFGFEISSKSTTATADVNSNVVMLPPSPPLPIIETELTELQKNRIKMMQSETTFSNFGKELVDDRRKNLFLDLNTERARNRQKVLSSEFDLPIVTPMSIKTTTTSENYIQETPMSTSSDNPDSKDEEQEEDEINARNKDKINMNLILDIEKAKLKQNYYEKDYIQTVSTAENLQTPENALNTAGVLAKKGFDFGQSNTKSKQSKDDLIPEISEELSVIDDIQDENIDIYKRCEELIKSNFTCKPKHSIFSIRKPSLSQNNDKKKSTILHSKSSMDTTNIITLTEFIQKSILIPLNTHTEIISNEIMRIFLVELDILGHFKSLRNYFFLMDGEFGSLICDGLIGKLENGAKPMELLNFQVLHTILENALGSSIHCNDKNSINLSFIVSGEEMPEKFDLTSPSVLNCLTLSYQILWPLNLVLNPETLQQYGNIFKYLLKVRRISWLLEDVHQNLQALLKTHGSIILQSPQYHRVQQIRHKFYHFVNVLKNHITSNALQASWKTFKDDLLQAKTMEDLYRKHTIYIKRILFLCLLNKKSTEYNNAIENIFKITIRFVRNLKSREWKQKSNEHHFTHSKYERLLSDEAEFEKFIKFVIYLGNKIVKHGYQEEIGEFIELINFNRYYSSVDS